MGPENHSTAIRDPARHQPLPAQTGDELGRAIPPPQLTTDADRAADSAPRSSFGTVPGAEFPAFVYVSVVAAFGWLMLASWLAFARDMDADLALGIAIVLAVVFFALPFIIHRVALAFSHPQAETVRDFLVAPVETQTGALSGSSAWVQVLIIPLSVALAATLIGAASLLVR